MSFDLERSKILEDTNQKLNLTNELINGRNLVFVYCPQKVGSTSIVSSIRLSATRYYCVLHIHDETFLRIMGINSTVTILDIIQYNQQFRKVYVIDIYRTPVERKMSTYFEHISDFHFNTTDEIVNTYNMQRINRRFNDIFPHLCNDDYYSNTYKIPKLPKFNFEKKYLLQEINGVKYIKVRLIDSYQWNTIFTEILGVPITIIEDYETERKCIGQLYRSFKQSYKLPINFLDFIKACPFFNYYYSEVERNEYLNKWASTEQPYTPYSGVEYALYNRLTIENQIHNQIQSSHYIDLGCYCPGCAKKRHELLDQAKRGEKITDKIVHEHENKKYTEELLKKKQFKLVTRHEKLMGAGSTVINNDYMKTLVTMKNRNKKKITKP